jgi:hypothetical protein
MICKDTPPASFSSLGAFRWIVEYTTKAVQQWARLEYDSDSAAKAKLCRIQHDAAAK